MHTFVAKTLRYIYTSFWVIWTIFHRLDIQFPSKKKLQDFCRVSKKILFFWPKIGEKLLKIFKILKININHLNTLPVQILGHLDHFWQNMAIFVHFWAIFCPIYKEMWRSAVIPPLALSAITFEPLIRFQKFLAFWKALELGYIR